MPSSPPPLPPVDELFDELSGENLGHLKKNIVQRNVAEKKFGDEKNSCTEKLPNLPPPKYLMVRPLVAEASPNVCSHSLYI